MQPGASSQAGTMAAVTHFFVGDLLANVAQAAQNPRELRKYFGAIHCTRLVRAPQSVPRGTGNLLDNSVNTFHKLHKIKDLS